jgi:hypothetical protein
MTLDTHVRWIRAALLLQFTGYVVDAVWHGLLSPGVEPRTVAEMARHLATVHLPLYVGAAAVLVTTLAALAQSPGREAAGLGLPVAFAGAVVSAGAEAWHAVSHLQLDTHTGPVAGTLGFVGFLVVAGATWSLGRHRRRAERDAGDRRRAA